MRSRIQPRPQKSCRGAVLRWPSATPGATRPIRPIGDVLPGEDRADVAGHEQRLGRPARTRTRTPSIAPYPLDDALDIEEIHFARGGRPVLVGARSRPRRRSRVSPSCAWKRAPIPEQGDVAAAVPPVVRDGVHQAGQQRRPQRVEFSGQGIGDQRTGSGAPAFRRVKRARRLGLDEAKGDRFESIRPT